MKVLGGPTPSQLPPRVRRARRPAVLLAAAAVIVGIAALTGCASSVRVPEAAPATGTEVSSTSADDSSSSTEAESDSPSATVPPPSSPKGQLTVCGPFIKTELGAWELVAEKGIGCPEARRILGLYAAPTLVREGSGAFATVEGWQCQTVSKVITDENGLGVACQFGGQESAPTDKAFFTRLKGFKAPKPSATP